MVFRIERPGCGLGKPNDARSKSYKEGDHPLTALIHACGCLVALELHEYKKFDSEFSADGFHVACLAEKCEEHTGNDASSSCLSEAKVREGDKVLREQLRPAIAALLTKTSSVLSDLKDEKEGKERGLEAWWKRVLQMIALSVELEMNELSRAWRRIVKSADS